MKRGKHAFTSSAAFIGIAILGMATSWSVAQSRVGNEQVAEGRAIATRSGCLSCHGSDLTGTPKLTDPAIAVLYSSNLTRVRSHYTDQQLKQTIRTAIRPDGTHLWFMAAPYAALTARDMNALVAFIRSVPSAGEDHGRIRMGPRFIKAVHSGRLQPEAIEQARDKIVPPDFGARFSRGRYLARTSCAGCHYPSLNGQPDPQPDDAPNLSVAAAYSEEQFRTLLRTGVALGHRQVGVMSEEAPKRFAGLSDADINAIRAYLVRRAAK